MVTKPFFKSRTDIRSKDSYASLIFQAQNPRRSREWLTDGGKLSAGLISQSNFLTQYILQFKQIVESLRRLCSRIACNQDAT